MRARLDYGTVKQACRESGSLTSSKQKKEKNQVAYRLCARRQSRPLVYLTSSPAGRRSAVQARPERVKNHARTQNWCMSSPRMQCSMMFPGSEQQHITTFCLSKEIFELEKSEKKRSRAQLMFHCTKAFTSTYQIYAIAPETTAWSSLPSIDLLILSNSSSQWS